MSRLFYEGKSLDTEGAPPQMKLKDEYLVYYTSEEELVAVPSGEATEKFKGLLRANNTASAIIEYLKEDLTLDELVDKMEDRFDASREEIRAGVNSVLEILRSVDALVE